MSGRTWITRRPISGWLPADDEDPQVRWAARYALRLDLEREPGRPALARWPRDGGISGCRPH